LVWRSQAQSFSNTNGDKFFKGLNMFFPIKDPFVRHKS
jgi:hypothetical protein